MKESVPTITLNELLRRYGRMADVVLKDFIRSIDGKGTQRKFLILATLPSRENYLRMRSVEFSKPLAKIVESAFLGLEGLREELETWYNSLPAGFKAAKHGKTIKAALDCMTE